MVEKVILIGDEIHRTIARIAHEIIEHNHSLEDLIIVGMYTRGVPLACRLADNIKSFSGVEAPVGFLDIGPYRDDLPVKLLKKIVPRTEIPVSVVGKSVVLVDDVIYTGRSIRAAMDAIINLGRPRSIQLAVFIDRGHRELPIRADYVGKSVPSARDEEIAVRLKETDGIDEVVVIRRPKVGLTRIKPVMGGKNDA